MKKATVHKPVLVQEVLTYLAPGPHETFLDVTFGSGGHTRAILEKEPTCHVIALDWDAHTLEEFGAPLQEEFGDRLTLVWGNFAHLYKIAKKEGIKAVDGILADFGTSQVQLSQSDGFSFHYDTPLDMRMSPAHQKITAADIVNSATQEELEEIFFKYGEERHARRIARALIHDRAATPFRTTFQLAQLIERVSPEKHRGTHPATKVFQALRIYVNQELTNIQAFFPAALELLKPQGRLVCISFHSLEDRMVKHYFQDQERLHVLEVITKKAVVGTEQELQDNPSARSAKLRAARKL